MYDDFMDEECVELCNALNSLSGVETKESCCGHCKDNYKIFFSCHNNSSLSIIARAFDRRYSDTHLLWIIELTTVDDGTYLYFAHSVSPYNNKGTMMEDVSKLSQNIKHWMNHGMGSSR